MTNLQSDGFRGNTSLVRVAMEANEDPGFGSLPVDGRVSEFRVGLVEAIQT